MIRTATLMEIWNGYKKKAQHEEHLVLVHAVVELPDNQIETTELKNIAELVAKQLDKPGQYSCVYYVYWQNELNFFVECLMGGNHSVEMPIDIPQNVKISFIPIYSETDFKIHSHYILS